MPLSSSEASSPARAPELADSLATSERATAPDRRRYRRTLRFFFRLLASLIWWEIILRKLAGAGWVGCGAVFLGGDP